MKTQADIITLAEAKLRVGEFLLNNGFYDEAYYLGGYALELLLKAKICKTLSIPDFFDFDNAGRHTLPSSRNRRNPNQAPDANLYKPYRVHDYVQLLILSGLFVDFSTNLGTAAFMTDWSIVSRWHEGLRYTKGETQQEVTLFFQSLNNIVTWLRAHL